MAINSKAFENRLNEIGKKLQQWDKKKKVALTI
jgi:hypothetical protein